MVSLDIAKPFDTVRKYRILLSLQKLQLNGNILKFINNLLANRSFEVKYRNTLSSSFVTENGFLLKKLKFLKSEIFAIYEALSSLTTDHYNFLILNGAMSAISIANDNTKYYLAQSIQNKM